MSALGPLATPAAPAGPNTVPTASVRTAQAAFFRAALDGVAAPQPRPEPRADARPGDGVTAAAEPAPARHGRPGALLDIRV